jgi:N-acetylglutamate synthase-like GNAT family acetyltransferase
MTAIQFQLRQATTSDLPEIAALLSEGLSFDGLVFVQTAEELAEEFDGTYCSLDHDVIVATHESRIIGVGYTIFLPSETKEERCYIFGTTKPDFRGNGVGTAVMQWASEHGESLLRSTNRTIPKYLRSDMSATDSSAGSLFQSFNMSPVRWNDDLIIDLAKSPAVFTALGYSIVAWDSSRDEEARVVKTLHSWTIGALHRPARRAGNNSFMALPQSLTSHSLHSTPTTTLLACCFHIDMNPTMKH